MRFCADPKLLLGFCADWCPRTEFNWFSSLLLLPQEVLTLPGGTVELGAFLPTFPRAFTASLGLVSLARVGSFHLPSSQLAVGTAWCTGDGKCSVWDAEGVLMVLLITEIPPNPVLALRVSLGDTSPSCSFLLCAPALPMAGVLSAQCIRVSQG